MKQRWRRHICHNDRLYDRSGCSQVVFGHTSSDLRNQWVRVVQVTHNWNNKAAAGNEGQVAESRNLGARFDGVNNYGYWTGRAGGRVLSRGFDQNGWRRWLPFIAKTNNGTVVDLILTELAESIDRKKINHNESGSCCLKWDARILKPLSLVF